MKHFLVENSIRSKPLSNETNREVKIKKQTNKDLMALDSKNYKIGSENWV